MSTDSAPSTLALAILMTLKPRRLVPRGDGVVSGAGIGVFEVLERQQPARISNHDDAQPGRLYGDLAGRGRRPRDRRLRGLRPMIWNNTMQKIKAFFTGLAAVLAMAASLATAGTVTYYHNDLTGSPVVASNALGQVIWRESYRPYGERTVKSAQALDNTVWFTSRRQDPETGLVYMGARYYDPLVGRFVSTDPVLFDEKNLHSFNRYAYGNNNPYRYTDPDGKAAETIFDAVSFGISVAIFRNDPTLANFAGAAIDGLAMAVPLVPGGVGAIRSIGKGADFALDSANVSDKTAEITRAENIAKGIPESQLGPSGKPKIHVIDHGGKRKEAKDAARAEAGSGGTTMKHTNPKVGQDHYHGVKASGEKDRVHHEYND